MLRKLLWIISEDLDATGQELITYFAFSKQLREMGIKWSSVSVINKLQKILWFS